MNNYVPLTPSLFGNNISFTLHVCFDIIKRLEAFYSLILSYEFARVKEGNTIGEKMDGKIGDCG